MRRPAKQGTGRGKREYISTVPSIREITRHRGASGDIKYTSILLERKCNKIADEIRCCRTPVTCTVVFRVFSMCLLETVRQ